MIGLPPQTRVNGVGRNNKENHYSGMIYGALMAHQGMAQSLILCGVRELNIIMLSVMLSWRSGKRPRLRARRVKVRFSLRAIILSLENLNVIIRAIN